MADDDDSAEKPFEATPRKLEEARRKGEVPLSQDLITSSVFIGVLVTAAIFGQQSAEELGTSLVAFLDQPQKLADVAFGGGNRFLSELLKSLFAPLVVWFAAPVIFALLCAVVQNALLFAPTKAFAKTQ